MAGPTNGIAKSLAIAMLGAPIYCAWGSGDTSWDSLPVPLAWSDTALRNELGRRRVDTQRFCTPNTSGDIILPPSANNASGKWLLTDTPTPFLYLKTGFHVEDSPGPQIREVGYLLGVALQSSVPSSQHYFLPADVLTPGVMFAGNRFVAITRTSGLTQWFEFVIDLSGVLQ